MGDTTTTPAVCRHFEPAIAITAIRRNASNPRKHFDQASLAELAASIKQHGLLQPIAVWHLETPMAPHRSLKSFEVSAIEAGVQAGGSVLPKFEEWQTYIEDQHEGRYLVLLGERRWRAAYLAGINEVPAIVYTGLSNDQALEMALVENLQRQDMNAMEEAEGFDALAKLGRTQAQIADRVGKSRARVSNAMRLLDLPEGVKEHVRAGLLSQKHAEGILRFKEYPKVLVAIADLAVKRGSAAAELAKGIPFAIDLQRAGVIQALDYDDLAPAGLDYDAAGTLKTLKALPFTRVEKGPNAWENDTVYVLDTAAWDAWLKPQIEAFEERNRKKAEQVARELAREQQKKAATSGAAGDTPADDEDDTSSKATKLVDLDKLGYGKYKIIGELEADVRRQIPPEKIELGTKSWCHAPGWKKGDPIKFTRDVALCDKLQRQASVAKNRVQRAKLDVAFECAVKNVKAIKEVGSEDLAQVAEWALQFGTDIDGAFGDLGITPTEELHKLKPLQILQLVILARVRGVYSAAHRDAHAMPDDLEVYAGKWEPEYKKRVQAKEKEEAKKQLAAAGAAAAKKAQAKSDAKVAKKKAQDQAKKGGRVAITPELRESILAAIKEGSTGSQVAKKFGVSLPTVQNIKRDAGLTKVAAAAK